MASLFHSFLLLPLVFLLRFLYNANINLPQVSASSSSSRIKLPTPTKNQQLTERDIRNFVHISEDDQKRFNDTLRRILVPRVADTPSHLGVQEFIINYLKDLDWLVETDQFVSPTPFGEKRFTNIIATLNPGACKRVILSCHYDSKYFAEFDFLGATDSAVPCSMMLEIVRVLDSQLKKHKEATNDVTLQLMFFDGEEAFKEWTRTDSLYGSRHLAAKMNSETFRSDLCSDTKLQTELDRVELFVLLDLIGEASPQFCRHSSVTRHQFERLTKIERKLNKMKLLQTRRASGTNYFPTRCSYSFRVEDDHVPFEENGVPVLHIISTPFPFNWHKEGDNGDNLHQPTINNLIKVFRLFLVEYFNLKPQN